MRTKNFCSWGFIYSFICCFPPVHWTILNQIVCFCYEKDAHCSIWEFYYMTMRDNIEMWFIFLSNYIRFGSCSFFNIINKKLMRSSKKNIPIIRLIKIRIYCNSFNQSNLNELLVFKGKFQVSFNNIPGWVIKNL